MAHAWKQIFQVWLIKNIYGKIFVNVIQKVKWSTMQNELKANVGGVCEEMSSHHRKVYITTTYFTVCI